MPFWDKFYFGEYVNQEKRKVSLRFYLDGSPTGTSLCRMDFQIKYSKLRLFQVFRNLASWSRLQHTNYFLKLLKTKTTIAQFATVLIIKEAKWENILIKSNLLKDVFPKLLVNERNCQGNRTSAFYVAHAVSRTRCLVNNLQL